MEMSGTDLKARQAVLVTSYATPFAVVLVAAGIVLSQPSSPYREISIGLLLFSIVFNIAAVRWIERHQAASLWLIRLRLALNLAVNIGLVYMLGGFWPPIWLLLALTPIATAIYDTKAKTLLVSLAVAAVLLAIHALRGPYSPLEWGAECADALFIVLMSLLVNGLSRLPKPAPGPGAVSTHVERLPKD